MKKDCWGIQWRSNLVSDPSDYSAPVRTLLFKSRRHAEAWLEDNQYWTRLKAKPVKVRVKIEIK